MRTFVAWGGMAAALLLAGCQPSSDPVAVAESFHRALSRGDGDAALQHLSSETRAELDSRAKRASEVADQKLTAADMIVGGDLSAYPAPWTEKARQPAQASLVSMDEQEATVKVTAAGRTSELKLVREKAGWRIVLPLAPAPGS